jgi:hypothetical protein
MEFKGSMDWLHRFWEHYGIYHKTICGEENDAGMDGVSSWRKEQLKDII